MAGEILVNGHAVECRYVEKPRMRNAYLRFRGDTLVVTASSERKAEQVIMENRRWIEKHYMSIISSTRLFSPNGVMVNGKRLIALFKESRSPFVEMNRDVVIVGAGTHDKAESLIDRWLAGRSMLLVSGMAGSKAAENGLHFNGIKACRGSKWGSCSSDNELRFNRYICMLPEEVAGYVVAHELAHTEVMSHSKDFWERVGRLCPDYKRLRKELRGYDSYRRRVFIS